MIRSFFETSPIYRPILDQICIMSSLRSLQMCGVALWDYYFMRQSIAFAVLALLLCQVCVGQYITPLGNFPILPYDTTQGANTSYSFYFNTDTDIEASARVQVIFPMEFDSRTLALFSNCQYKGWNDTNYSPAICSVSFNTFTIEAGTIIAGNLSVVINGVVNPYYVSMSSQFTLSTLFKTIHITTNPQFGQTPFSSTPATSSTGTVTNAFNTLIDQGSSWIFTFTPSNSYAANSSLRFIFPSGFSTNKIVCNVTGLFNSIVTERVLPSGNIYDCLNINKAIPASVEQRVFISGIVNPKFQMTANNFKVQILQGNGIVIMETISVTGSQVIGHKDLKVSMTYPNRFRNNSIIYTFMFNVQSDLFSGDYIKMTWGGSWTFHLNSSTSIVTGVNGSPYFTAIYNTTASTSTLLLQNFSSILVSNPITFYVSLKTPLNSGAYSFDMETHRASGALVEEYSTTININDTTAYIKQLRMHPVHPSVKLPVGKTGPLEIVLGLNKVLPNTDVLSYGKIDIVISPQIPLPPTNTNGVPKCYFFGTTPAYNCTYDVLSSPLQTRIIIFTPKDFVFFSSQIPIMVTTEGYTDPSYQGITIDTLVKRYLFKIQFYTSYQDPNTPTQVLFTQWIPDSVPMSSVVCSSALSFYNDKTHLVCNLTTPPIDLCANGHVHIFRIEFLNGGGWDANLGYTPSSGLIFQDYPCLMSGPNLAAVPYVKCDLVTFKTGPYALTKANPGAYLNIYGFSLLPGSSTLTIEVPGLMHGGSWGVNAGIRFTINEQTWGMRDYYVELYSQQIDVVQAVSYTASSSAYTSTSITNSFANPTPNQNTTFTFGPFAVGTTAIDTFILQVDQTIFPDIGRGYRFACGSDLCSKFNKPHQYFILYPQTSYPSSVTLTFPYIMTPPYAGSFTFYMRTMKSGSRYDKRSFTVTINPQTITAASFDFDSTYQTTTTLFPNRQQFYKVAWTTINPLPASTSSIIITFSGITISSTYTTLTTTATSADGKGIQVDRTSSTVFKISNLGAVPAATSFTLGVRLISSSTASTISPTVTVVTYYSGANPVDQITSLAHTNNPITNTNLKTFTNFNVASPQILSQKLRKGYFGPIQFYFGVMSSSTATNGRTLIFTPSSGGTDYTPVVNSLNLPIICQINSVRYACTYTLNPLIVTITHTSSFLSTANSTLNITTQYLQPLNGFNYPTTAGRYMATMQVKNSASTILEKSEFYYDILPDDVVFFNATFAHRDTSSYNIFTFNIRTGSVPVPAYNDGTSAGRIYIGFPVTDAVGNGVFSQGLGYTGMGTVIPCWFTNDSSYVQPATGSLACRLRPSPGGNTPAYVEILNFQAMPANSNMQIIMGRIMNPTSVTVDVNFVLKIFQVNPLTLLQTPLFESIYNMFFDMRSLATASASEPDSTTVMFEPGAKVGDQDKYMTIIPYTPGSFSSGDWFILQMNSQFKLTTKYDNCLTGFYLTCIPFPTVNWLAIQIGNGTLVNVYPHIEQLPLSISRTNTFFNCYTFTGSRFTYNIQYTLTAANRWKELQGSLNTFTFQVLGRQEKATAMRSYVEVMIGFKTAHLIPANGAIEIQWPNNSTLVPYIKSHCRSAVTVGSLLYGQKAGTTQPQGEVGCYVQNTYSWIITGNDDLPAGSQVYITGEISMPLVATTNLGTGYVVTYVSDDSTNTFTTSRIIDYMSTNFQLNINTTTWWPDETAIKYVTGPLKVGHVGELKFMLRVAQQIVSTGYILLNMFRETERSSGAGFGIPTNPVCTIVRLSNDEKYGCKMTVSSTSTYVTYTLDPYDTILSGVDYVVTLTTQNGGGSEGIIFPTAIGVYKIQTFISYSSGNSQVVSNSFHIEVYGSSWTMLNFYSTVTLPGEKNLIMVELTPSTTINSNQQVIIEIPTVAIDGTSLFDEDLGMGYIDYSDLVFDIYDGTITSMTCKVYPGQRIANLPVKIICSSFSGNIGTSSTLKFGFWITNPTVTRSLAVPVQVYSFDQNTVTKSNWNILQSGFKLIVTSNSPILDNGNFAFNTATYQTYPVLMSFTTRNTAPLLSGDFYIVKVNFDPRQNGLFSSGFVYNSGLGASGTLYILRTSKTYVLKVGATSLASVSGGSTGLNAQIKNVKTPYWMPSSAEQVITAYAAYISSATSEKINHKDALPALSPKQPASPSFTFAALTSNAIAGQLQDYRFSFTHQSSGTADDMQYAAMFAIVFPSSTVNDFGFAGTECVEGVSSGIEVASCVIDTSNRVIWVTPVMKSSYVTGTALSIQTRNKAIKNPTNLLSVAANSFEVRVYSWNTATAPTLLASNMDYVYLRQKSNFGGSVIATYTAQSVPLHTAFNMRHARMVSEWQPSNTSTGTNLLTPFRFKFRAMAAFSDLSTSGNSHTLVLKYGSRYTATAASTSLDMSRYVTTCYLNQQRIQSCTINSGAQTVTMLFKQALAINSENSVRMSVLNPLDEQDDGFKYTGIASADGTYTGISLSFTPYSGSTYYVEPEPFHPYFKSPASTSYPYFGITSATLYVGSYVASSLNLLEFNFAFSRNDIKGLVIEIPNVDADGDVTYTNPILMNLPSGSNFPCSVGFNLDVTCYYETGSTSGYGIPTRIYVANFALQAGNTLMLRLLITNPDNVGVWPTINVKAMGGTTAVPEVFGDELLGRWTFPRIFKTLLNNATYYLTDTNNNNWQPAKTMYATGNYWPISNDWVNLVANDYAILAINTSTTARGEVHMFNPNSAYCTDYFFVNYGAANRVLYILRKITGTFNAPSTINFGEIRSRHFMQDEQYVYYFKSDGLTRFATHPFNVTRHQNNLANFGITIVKMDVQTRQTSAANTHFLSLSLTNFGSISLSATDPADLVLCIQFDAIPLFSALGSAVCSVQSGIDSTDPLVYPYCQLANLASKYQIIIKKFNKFTATTPIVNVFYSATNVATASPGTTTVSARLYASTAAFGNLANTYDWYLAYGSDTYTYSTVYWYYDRDRHSTAYYTPSDTSTRAQFLGLTSGYARVTGVSSTTISFQMQPATTLSLSSGYSYIYRFSVQRLNPSSTTCSASGFTSCEYDSTRRYIELYDAMAYSSWSASTTRSVTVTINTGIATPVEGLSVHFMYMVASRVYYYDDCIQCGRDANNDCKNCYMFDDWHSWAFSSGTSYDYTDTTGFLDSQEIGALSLQSTVETELYVYMNNFALNVGPSYNNYLYIDFTGGSWPSNNMFKWTYNNETIAKIDCKCYIGTAGISYSTVYTDTDCYRFLGQGYTSNAGIMIEMDVAAGSNLKCYFPSYYGSGSGISAIFRVLNSRTIIAYPEDAYSYRQNSVSRAINNSGSLSSSYLSVSEPSYLSSARTVASTTSVDYYMRVTNSYGGFTDSPWLYISMASPVPSPSWCQKSPFGHCRVYNNYINRMYYVVVHVSANGISEIELNVSAQATLPPSKEYSTTYLQRYVAWVQNMNSYYQFISTASRNHNNLNPHAPTLSRVASLYSSDLASTSGTQIFTIGLMSKTFFGWYSRGPNAGSFGRFTFGGGMTINGCAVWISNRLDPVTNAIFCTVSSNTVTITTRDDITSSGTMYLVIQTNSVPSSYSSDFTLYDKYRSGSDYSTTIYNSLSNGRTASGTILSSTYVLWRRPTYKELRTDRSAITFTFSAGYDFVYNDVTPANSNSFILTYPAASGISSSFQYSCTLREYPAGSYHLYNQWTPKCQYYAANQLKIDTIPGHIMSSTKTYELTILNMDNSNTSLFGVPSTSTYNVDFTSYAGTTAIYSNRLIMRRYQQVYPIALNQMYILTKEAGVANSLCLQFVINTAGSSAQEIEFRFTTLGLSNFQVNSGQEIPCWISTGFSAISGRSVKCTATSPGINADTPLHIRVTNFNSFTSGTTFKLAFDQFTNPSPNTMVLTPMDLTMSYLDMTTNNYYESTFNEIYATDSVNVATNPTDVNAGYQNNSNIYGASTYHSLNFNWPQASGGSVSEKTVLKFTAGVLCCQALTGLTFDTSSGANFNILWANTKANLVVLASPSLSAVGISLRIWGVRNPYPYQVTQYNTSRQIEMVVYSGYKRVGFDSITPLAFSAYTVTSNYITLSSVSGPYHNTNSNKYHSSLAITYDFSFTFANTDFTTRKITYCEVVFTAGVGTIEAAYSWINNYSPYYINPVGNIKYFYSGGNWRLNITGLPDSVMSTSASQNWVVRLRFYPTGSTISYTSTAYCYNGLTEFTNSGSQSISGYYNNSNLPASTLLLSQRRYFYDFYELQHKPIYPAAGATSRRLIFRFTAAYNVSEVESFSIVLPTTSATGPFVLVNTPGSVICVFNPTVSNKTTYGAAYYTTCTYSSFTYSIKAPSGGLVAGTEYTLSIMQLNQLSSSFYMPTSPMRQQLTLIYNSITGMQYGDNYVLSYTPLFTSFSIAHSTLMASDSSYSVKDTIAITFTPKVNMNAAVLSGSITEAMLVFEIPTRYFSDDVGIPTVFTNQGKTWTNGQYYTHVSSPSVAASATRFMKGQRTRNYTPMRFSVTYFSDFLSTTSYTFKFPLIVLPQGDNIPLTYKVSLVSYANNVATPVIMGEYVMQNLQSLTSGGSRSWVYTGFVTSSAVVQSTMSLTFNFTNWNDIPNGSELMLKLNNNNIAAWTSILSLKSPSNTNYNTSEYYPNINLLRIWKTTTTTQYTVSLGTYPTSDDVQSWGFTFAYVSSSSIYYNGYFSGSWSYSASISAANSWTSGTLTRLNSGLNYISVVNQYSWTWSSNSLTFPEGSYMVLTFARLNIPTPLADNCKSISGFPLPTVATNVLACRRTGSNQITVTGYGTIGPNIALTITSWMTNTGSTQSVTITVYSATGSLINSASRSGITVGSAGTSGLNFNYLNIKQAKQVSLYSQTTTPMVFTFTLSTYSLLTGDYVTLDLGNWTVGTASPEGSVTWKYKVGNWVYWVPTAVTVSGSIVTIPVYANYSMTPGNLIQVSVSHIMPTDFNGIKVTNSQWNYFTLKAVKSSAVVEHQYVNVWVPTDGVATFTAIPVLTYTGANTLYTFTITPNVDVVAGDVISIEFVTNDLKYNFFDVALGKTFTTTSYLMGCQELDDNHLISDDRIVCELFKGNAGTQTPVVIQIPVTKSIASGTLVTIVITEIPNPSSNANLPVGITGKILRVCQRGDQTNLCAIFKSTYYQRLTTAGVPGTSVTATTTMSPTTVSASPAVHTISHGSATISSGDYMKVTVTSPMWMTEGCVVAGHSCWAFPQQNHIIIKFNSAISPLSVAIQNMSNFYKQSSSSLAIEVWRSGVIASRFSSTYSLATIVTDPTTSNALSIGFEPTLTSNYQLKVNFNNIARIEIKYIFQNSNVNSIWLTVPSGQITLITTYCNATLSSSASEAKPYPYRFYCEHMGSGKVRLTLPSSFPVWDTTFPGRSVILYLEYIIADHVVTATLNDWIAIAYAGTTETNADLISRANGKFDIAPYISPPISSVDFHTTSFTSRTCTTNDQCMFYGYLLPSTEQSSYQISKMVFTLPREFSYAPITSLTKCLMKGYTDVSITSCNTDRQDSVFRITYVPASYDHNYKLITLNTDDTKLFTSPANPGTHYQMKADIYTTLANGTDLLVETSSVNLTTVFGEYLLVPSIIAKIPLDADAYGLFDVQFLVGTKDIPPAYQSTSSNTIVSQIVLIFANNFAFDLGTGLSAGSQVACVPISGLTFNTMDRLTCRLYPSTSSITYPTIRATGYDKVANGSTIRLQLAGLKTLPFGITDYIKVGVELVYFDYGGVTGNLYEPTSVVVGPPTNPINPSPITFTISENSSNLVGELANYNITGTITSGFSNVKTSDYFAVEFPMDTFERKFSINSAAVCSMATDQKCNSFGRASIIYFSPSATHTTSALSFTLQNITQSAYLFDYKNVTFTLYTIVDNKVNAKGTATMIKVARTSKNATALITSTSSSYGGDTGINYTIQFQLNHQLPTDGVVTVTMPNDYLSLYSLNAQCILTGELATALNPYCTIGADRQVNIYPNKISLSPSRNYGFTLTNITNPNKFLNGDLFTLTTYYNSNIYNKTIISLNTFPGPTISVSPTKNCTFQVTPTATNANMSTSYKFTMICPAFIKQSSEVKVYLPWRPSLNGNLTCSSGTDSLYSNSCAIRQEFNGSIANTYLSLLVRNITSMKLFEFSTTLTNPASGNYTIQASVSYRGATSLVASSSVYISALSFNTSRIPITVSNYPQNAGQQACYVFKLPFIPMSSIPSLLTITFPSVFVSFNSISCSYRVSSSNLNFTYVDLMLSSQNNQLTCTSTGSTVSIYNVSTVFNTTGANSTSSYFYYIVYGAVNPSSWSVTRLFTLTYQTSSTVFWTNTQNLSYSVSATPAYMQINGVASTVATYLTLADYTFNLSASSAINIPASTPIAVVIEYPPAYNSVWDRMPKNCTVNITLGSNVYTTTASLGTYTTYSLSNITTNISFTSVKVQVFQWRNPNDAVDCKASPVFKVFLYDLKFNNVIVSTMLNNQDCLTFNNRLYKLQIQGNSVIQSGTIANYSIVLERPADSLTITPSTTSSAISFSPSSVVFSNFTSNVSSFMIKAAPSLTGNYTVKFTKTQGSNGIFFNDIPDMNITVIAPINPFYMSFTSVDTKSIGLPVTIGITLTPASSSSFTLFYTHNCSAGYSLSPSSSLLIPSNTSNTNISITYKGSVVPPVCAITFSLGFSNYNYQLTSRILYVAGYISKDKSSIIPPMRLVIAPTAMISTDVNKTIINANNTLSERLRPIIYSLKLTSRQSNSANFSAVLTQVGTLYYVVVPAGTPQTLRQSSIMNSSVPSMVSSGSSIATKSINIITNFQASGLSSQSQYKLAAYLSSTVGDSDIIYLRFNTSQASNGAELIIALKTIESNASVLAALSKVLRIPVSRMAVLTFSTVLTNKSVTFNATIMNEREYTYQIVIAPNPANETMSPIDLANSLKTNSSLQNKLLGFLPTFNTAYPIYTRQVLAAKPRLSKPVTIPILTYQSVTLDVTFWQQAYVYGVILPAPSASLLSKQVISGFDGSNTAVAASQYISTQTNLNGSVTLQFKKLNGNVSYVVHISAESILPYTPRLAMTDSEVVHINVTTMPNLNLRNSQQRIVEILSQYDPEMSAIVDQHIKANNMKTNINKNNKGRVRVVRK